MDTPGDEWTGRLGMLLLALVIAGIVILLNIR